MSHQRILIDTTFLFEKTHKGLIGAKIIKYGKEDVTNVYGFLREILLLYRKIRLQQGLFLIGENAYRIAPKEEIERIVKFLKKLSLPLLHQPRKPILIITVPLRHQFDSVLTHDKSMLQLITVSFNVLFPDSSNKYVSISQNSIKSFLGVAAPYVETIVALTELPQSLRLTKRQAIRLIELYGDLNEIYKHLKEISSLAIRNKLSENETKIRSSFARLQVNLRQRSNETVLPKLSVNFDTKGTKKLLTSYGFFSLVRKLPMVEQNSSDSSIIQFESREHASKTKYVVVVDIAGLSRLKDSLLEAEYCAIDTESDGKDPHSAVLLGVSFAVKQNAAYFVPFAEKDLIKLSIVEVTRNLRKILDSKVKFVGHNIKFDYILLQRNGMIIRNVFFDTMLAAYDCYGDLEYLNLPFLAEQLLGRKIRSYNDIVPKNQTFLDLPFKEMFQHGCEDADVTIGLYGVLDAELADKGIRARYFNETLSLLRHLAELEYKGVNVSLQRLNKLRERLLQKTNTLKEKVFEEVGTTFDLDSAKALNLVVHNKLQLKSDQKITPSTLELLAINNPPLQCIVKYKRSKKNVKSIEAIIKCVNEKKVHPVFNQIQSRCDLLTSKNPNLFGIGDVLLSDSFGYELRPYFPSRTKSLNLLKKITKDKNLKKDCSNSRKTNQFLSKHKIAGQMEGVERDEFLLYLALGRSDFELSRRFLIDQMTVSTLRHDVEVRYQEVFGFLKRFRAKSVKKGFACNGGKRKYLAGLTSSNLARRQKAQEYAVRWLLQY